MKTKRVIKYYPFYFCYIRGLMKQNLEKDNKNKIKQIDESLFRKAMGYTLDEVTEEYVNDENGDIKLVKKKVSKKHVPADIAALKVWLENNKTNHNNKFDNLSDEEIKERIKKLQQKVDDMLKGK